MNGLYPILQGSLQNMLSSNWRRNTAGIKTNKQTKNMALIWLVSVAQSALHKRAGDETKTDFNWQRNTQYPPVWLLLAARPTACIIMNAIILRNTFRQRLHSSTSLLHRTWLEFLNVFSCFPELLFFITYSFAYGYLTYCWQLAQRTSFVTAHRHPPTPDTHL